MSTTALQHTTPQTAYLKPLGAPLKRKLSATTDEVDIKIKIKQERSDSIMTDNEILRPSFLMQLSEQHYGVYEHHDLDDHIGVDADLICTASNFYHAYELMREYAGEVIGECPEWGATSNQAVDYRFVVLGHDGEVRRRFEIAITHPAFDEESRPIWKRERDIPSQGYAGGPFEQYVMDITLDCHEKEHTKRHTMGAFHSVGEASNAMKTSAHSYLAKHAGARLLERSIELVNEKGEVQRRYTIGPGRYVNGQFITQQDWAKREAGIHAVQLASLLPSFPATRHPRKSSFMPLPSPPPAVYKATPHSQVASQATAQAKGKEKRDNTPWCTCRRPDDGALMLGCENDECPIQWYHGGCVDIEEAPEGEWYCLTCTPTHAPQAFAHVARPTRKQAVAIKAPANVKSGAGARAGGKKGKEKKRKTG